MNPLIPREKKRKIHIFLSAVVTTVMALSILLSQSFTSPLEKAFGQSGTRDLGTASSTVKLVSYRQAYLGNVIAEQYGSGTMIRSDGIFLTNSHVIKDYMNDALDAFEVCITFETNKAPLCEFSASLIAKNEALDLALLKVTEKDFDGDTLSNIRFLDYKTTKEVKTGDKIRIVGYPDTGEETITETLGQASGVSKDNGATYIKTDASISGGNSGGTALDESGVFIGVPTYVMYDIGNLGYILDIRDARTWIDQNIDLKPAKNEKAENALISSRNALNKANEQKSYTTPKYPGVKIDAPNNWKYVEITENSIQMSEKTQGKFSNISINILNLPFKVNKAFLERIFEIMDMSNKYASSYKREETTLNGYAAHSVRLSFYNYESQTYLIPYGYALITVTYDIELTDKTESKKKVDEVLKTLKLQSKVVDNPKVAQVFKLEKPSFSLSKIPNWYIIPNLKSVYDFGALVEMLRADSFSGTMELFYKKWQPAEQPLSNKELFEAKLKEYSNSGGFYQILAKNERIVLDDKQGWSITVSYPGERSQMKKRSDVYVRDGDYYYYFVYEDKDAEYDAYVEDFKKILKTFRDPKKSKPGKYEIGALNTNYKDISYHRFESEIAYLTEKGYLDGLMTGNTFEPEKKISRADALKAIIEAKIHYEEETKNLGKRDPELWNELEAYAKKVSRTANFKDTAKDSWYAKYIRYAKKKGYVTGYKDGNFRPNHRVTLAETLSMLFKAFEIPVWKAGSGIRWYEPLLDKGFEKRVIPYGVYDPGHEVTRGEYAYMLKQLLDSLEGYGYGYLDAY